MIRYVHGDLLNSHCTYICHQVNCQGVMNSGVAKQIRGRWPNVYKDYKIKCDECKILNISPLSDIQICALYDDFNKTIRHQYVVNIFAQYNYGYNNRRYTSYDAMWSCLNKIKEGMSEDTTIAFPYKLGSDRGGANWNVIRTMIEEIFGDREVFIYYLSEVDLLPEDRKRLA